MGMAHLAHEQSLEDDFVEPRVSSPGQEAVELGNEADQPRQTYMTCELLR